MGILGRLKKAIQAAAGALSGSVSPKPWLIDWFHGDVEADSGVNINHRTAMTYAPVWYAVNKIAGNLAMLPVDLMQRVGDRLTRRATEHAGYRLLSKRPNDLMTPAVFKELLTHQAILQGNGRAAIIRQGGRPVELIPLLADRTHTVLVNGQKWHVSRISETVYSTSEDTWLSSADVSELRAFPDYDVLHIPGLGYDGLTGYSVLYLAKNSWGLGLATEKHGNRWFKNNAVPGLILEAPPGVLADDQKALEFVRNFNSMQQGIDNTAKTALLRFGIKANALSKNFAESQAQETRLFQRQEAALWFLLEAILGDDQSVSYNSIEQKNLAYLTNGLMRWLVKWEEECAGKLLTTREFESDQYFFRFNVRSLLRADANTTQRTLTGYVNSRILSPNEARAELGLDPYEGGDEYANPVITPGAGAQPKPAEEDTAADDSEDKKEDADGRQAGPEKQ